MKILFVAYCMSNPEGDSLIGVYKRCLRIAMEMHRRGHEIFIFCTGRERYRDDLTAAAEERFRFLDFSLKLLFSKSPELKRRYFRRLFARLGIDLVVIGEMPLAGTLLDACLCGAELGIPVVFLDNAYSPDLSRLFHEVHGPMADGIVLTGPASFHASEAPETLCQVPPYLEISPERARVLLGGLGLRVSRLITVLAYETKAAQLAAKLLPEVKDLDCAALFLTGNVEWCRKRLQELGVLGAGADVRVLKPPEDPVYFGLLGLSNLVVGKCGFMQVSESLALGTPFIGIHYRGCFAVDLLPASARRFVHSTATVDPGPDTIAAARRFVQTDGAELKGIHTGEFGAIPRVAAFLEKVPGMPRTERWEQCARLGYPRDLLRQALEAKHGQRPLEVTMARCTRLRNLADSRIDSIVCLYTVAGRPKRAFLWGRIYDSAQAAADGIRAGLEAGPPRRVLYGSTQGRVMIEADAGEPLLPPLVF